MNWNCSTRCALVCFGFTALFSVFSFRLVQIQMLEHDNYAGLAAKKHVRKHNIYAERGLILNMECFGSRMGRENTPLRLSKSLLVVPKLCCTCVKTKTNYSMAIVYARLSASFLITLRFLL